MSESPRKLAPRSKFFSFVMAVPVTFFLVLLIVMLVLPMCMQMDGKANGERVRMVFSGECIREAQETIDFRMDKIGLGEPKSEISGEKLIVTAQLIGQEDDRTAIPSFLSQPGVLQLRNKDTVFATNKDIQSAAFYLDDRWNSYTIVKLHSQQYDAIQKYVDEYPLKTLQIWIDENVEIKRPNTKKIADDEIRLVPQLKNSKKQLRQAVDWSILFSKPPIPCKLKLDKIEAI